LLVSWREGHGAEVGELGLAEHVLDRLSDSDSSALLDARALGLPDGLRDRLLADAAGNPLALVELPTVAAGGRDDDAAMPLNARLELAFAERLDDLPDGTEALLLEAAADESLALSEILAGGEILLGRPATLAMLRPAVDARLVTLAGSGLRFRHPLVRSAIYQSADLEQRTAIHRALAQVFAAEADRRAFHRAAAALGPDESVALDLEEMAKRFQRRGAVLEAATSLGRAGQLSEERGARVRRLLNAAELAFEVGRADLVQGFVEEARSLGLSARDRARAQWLSEIFYDGVPGDAGRVRSLVETAEQAQDDDQELALTLLFGAALRCWWADPGADARARVVAAAERLPVDQTDPRVVQIIALAEPISRSGWVMDRVAQATSSLDDPEGALRLGMAAHAVGDFANSMRILRTAIEPLRAQGRLGLLTHAVGMFASAAVFVCDWTVAAGAAAEYEALARETNQPVWRGGAAVMQCAVAGMRGDDELADAFAAEAERLDSSGVNLSVLQNSRGLAALAAGRYDDAYAHLAWAFDPSDPAYHHREKYVAVGNLAEAAAATGRENEVRGLATELTASAEPAVERALLWGLRYARAILADDDHAEAEFGSALEAVGPQWVFNHARLNLAYGAWLRRQRRVIDSRPPRPVRADRAGGGCRAPRHPDGGRRRVPNGRPWRDAHGVHVSGRPQGRRARAADTARRQDRPLGRRAGVGQLIASPHCHPRAGHRKMGEMPRSPLAPWRSVASRRRGRGSSRLRAG
jgi:tetratricopeptide (TPR) repeat protein